jgi:hypothetical protein
MNAFVMLTLYLAMGLTQFLAIQRGPWANVWHSLTYVFLAMLMEVPNSRWHVHSLDSGH